MHFRMQSDVPAPATPRQPSDPPPCFSAYAISESVGTGTAGSNRQCVDWSSRSRRCQTKTVGALILVDSAAVDGQNCGPVGPVGTR